MHAGQFATLEDVVRHYATSPPAALGHSELAHPERKPIRLSESEINDLVAFLGALSSPISAGGSPRQVPVMAGTNPARVPDRFEPEGLARQ
jgi:hypothetical protein